MFYLFIHSFIHPVSWSKAYLSHTAAFRATSHGSETLGSTVLLLFLEYADESEHENEIIMSDILNITRSSNYHVTFPVTVCMPCAKPHRATS